MACTVGPMPDRPHDPPEYGWLYPEDEPEATQVMPRRQAPGQHPAAPARPGGPGGIQPEPGSRPRKRRRIPFPIGKIVLLLVLAWVAFLVAVPTLAWKKVD